MNLKQTGRSAIIVNQIIWITLFWTIVGMLDALNTHVISESIYIKRTAYYSFSFFFWLNTISSFLAGLISGTILIRFLRPRMRTKSFGFALLYNSAALTAINILIIALAFHIFISIEQGTSVFNKNILRQTVLLLRSPYYLKNIALWIGVIFLTIIFLHVNEKYGQGIFWRMLLGHYHHPREEERIFMFVDMKSSTAIAEKLGHVRFFNLLNDFFIDLTGPVVDTKGEIYQYVGDEVVISWPIRKGIEEHNCIRCFFLLRKTMRKAADRYEKRYGLVPDFKVGLHSGLVTTGEIGVIKKDIVFSGDVMNTTARIQAVCNKFRVSILISKVLLDKLQLPEDRYQLRRVGVIELKGKKQKVELYTFPKSIEPSSYEGALAVT